MKHNIAIVGCGTVGTALGKLLSKAGHKIVGVAAIHLESAKNGAKVLGTQNYSVEPWTVTPKADLVLLTTPDSAIKATCDAIAKQKGFKNKSLVVHCSGALSSEVLSSAKAAMALIASLHPLQSFASSDQAEKLLPGSYCAIEGDEKAMPLICQLAQDLGCVALELAPEDKVLYHAAAVVASNYLVTVINLMLVLIEAAGLDKQTSYKAFLPLIKGTLNNIDQLGIPKALTGPVARGDFDTVVAHIKAMEEKAPHYTQLYKVLTEYTIDIAKSKGTLTGVNADRLIAILKQAQR